MRFIVHFLIIAFLTILTQVGGIIYLLSLLIINKKKFKYQLKRVSLFIILYLLTTFLVVPKIAPIFGRIKIEDNHRIKSHTIFTKICNRNYVALNMHLVLNDISLRMNKKFPNIKIIYLDANFPFLNGFPLLPHLSHNDGNKIDICFIYEDENGNITNLKPSRSGYGIFENPKKAEYNQTNSCKEKGFWQYDFTKYLSFGNSNKNLKLSEKGTKILINKIINNHQVSKLFIEPHIKNRIGLKNSKIRFHGCKAVRHDDHIHFQIN